MTRYTEYLVIRRHHWVLSSLCAQVHPFPLDLMLLKWWDVICLFVCLTPILYTSRSSPSLSYIGQVTISDRWLFFSCHSTALLSEEIRRWKKNLFRVPSFVLEEAMRQIITAYTGHSINSCFVSFSFSFLRFMGVWVLKVHEKKHSEGKRIREKTHGVESTHWSMRFRLWQNPVFHVAWKVYREGSWSCCHRLVALTLVHVTSWCVFGRWDTWILTWYLGWIGSTGNEAWISAFCIPIQRKRAGSLSFSTVCVHVCMCFLMGIDPKIRTTKAPLLFQKYHSPRGWLFMSDFG